MMLPGRTNRNRFHTRFYGGYWDPFWYDSYWAFHVSWGWNRPHHFWHYSPYYYSSYYGYAHPVFFYGYHRPYHGWGGYGNTWIVYNHNTVNNNVYRGPRNSGVSRDGRNVGRGVASKPTYVAITVLQYLPDPRNSGVSRDNTTVRRSPATEGRSRGTVGRSTSQTGRSFRPNGQNGERPDPAHPGTVQRGNTVAAQVLCDPAEADRGAVQPKEERVGPAEMIFKSSNDFARSNYQAIPVAGSVWSIPVINCPSRRVPPPEPGINRSSADQGGVQYPH